MAKSRLFSWPERAGFFGQKPALSGKKPASFWPEAGFFWPEEAGFWPKKEPASSGKAGLHRPGVGTAGLEGPPFSTSPPRRGGSPRGDSAPGRAKDFPLRHGKEPAEAGRSRLLPCRKRAGFYALFRLFSALFRPGKEPDPTEALQGPRFVTEAG